MTSALVELRVLEGPNLYFPRAAMKLTLDLTALIDAPDEVALRFAARIGLRSARPGGSGSGFRQRFAARAVGRLVRQIAGEAGTSRVAVRVRPTADVHQIVVAYPWRNRNRAQELGHAVASVLDGLGSPDGATPEAVEKLVSGAADAVRQAELGPGPTTLRPRVPVVAVTGTNGKTTTSRMVAHIARMAGLHVGWSSTDGIYIDGELVEGGDYSGPSGAGRVLAHEEVQLAVTETARGGILLKGIGLAFNDVSVFTNVSADHLGLHGIDTLDQLAEVKGVVCRITRSDGWVVLNGDDPRVYATRSAIKAKPWVFSRDPDSPSVRETLTNGGRATTVIDGWLSVLTASADPDPLLEVADMPMTLAGLSRFNVENALAAVVGGSRRRAAPGRGGRRLAVVPARRGGQPRSDEPVQPRGVTVVIDLAHNEAGLEALLEVMTGVGGRAGAAARARRGRDRRTRSSAASGRWARGADGVIIGHKERYLRGRTTEELDELTGRVPQVVVDDVPTYPRELAALEALVSRPASAASSG